MSRGASKQSPGRPCLHGGITNSYSYRGVVINAPFVLISLLRDLAMDIRVQANSWQRSFVKVAGRNLSLLPLTAFKPTGKASRMSAMSKRSLGSSRAHVLAVLSDWDPQHRSQNKQNRPRSAFSFPAPSQPTDPATPRLECAALHRVPGATPSPKAQVLAP